VDNSEWMRNSDFSPSRFEAQEDACNLISGKKTRDNLENVVGLMTSAGKKGCEVHVSLSPDPGKLLTAMHKIKLGGEADLVSAIQIARV
jgi:26S proteasome regulatory subunit N10